MKTFYRNTPNTYIARAIILLIIFNIKKSNYVCKPTEVDTYIFVHNVLEL